MDGLELRARRDAQIEIDSKFSATPELNQGTLRELRKDLERQRTLAVAEWEAARRVKNSDLESVGLAAENIAGASSQALRGRERVAKILSVSPWQISFRIQQSSQALWNVKLVLFLTKFYQNLETELQSLQQACKDVSGVELYTLHKRLLRIERIAKSAAIECEALPDESNHIKNVFGPLEELREVIESELWNSLLDANTSFKIDREVLASAARIIEAEEDEDKFWNQYEQRGSVLLSRSLRQQKRFKDRAVEALIGGIASLASKNPDRRGRYSDSEVKSSLTKLSELVSKIGDAELIGRCFPERYGISEVVRDEFFRVIASRLSGVFRSALSDVSRSRAINWLIENSNRIRKHWGIGLQLEKEDRLLLRNFYFYQFEPVLQREIDRLSKSVNFYRGKGGMSNYEPSEDIYTHVPKRIFQFVRAQLEAGTSYVHKLKRHVRPHQPFVAPLVASAIVSADDLPKLVGKAAALLENFARRTRESIDTFDTSRGAYNVPVVVANDFSLCALFTEDISDWTSFFVPERHLHASSYWITAGRLFRETEEFAKAKLLDTLFGNIGGQFQKLFSPVRGKELLLDVVASTQSFLDSVKARLVLGLYLDVALSSLAMITNEYLAVFATAELRDPAGGAIIVQVEHDLSQLETLFEPFLHIRQFQIVRSSLQSTRDLLTCSPSYSVISKAYNALSSRWTVDPQGLLNVVLDIRPEFDKKMRQELRSLYQGLDIDNSK
ncbi:hypothetical protein NDN08_003647 [Rhodosorus marinus]|uniref:Exocyst complex component Sec6 n=1 Tax=Rhodosorus marinus TaxID=101924 RepID=A0AAV8UY73_9RHOD|nr:hypothetical protein NDN08_003647 [Rhodosorus marinus]